MKSGAQHKGAGTAAGRHGDVLLLLPGSHASKAACTGRNGSHAGSSTGSSSCEDGSDASGSSSGRTSGSGRHTRSQRAWQKCSTGCARAHSCFIQELPCTNPLTQDISAQRVEPHLPVAAPVAVAAAATAAIVVPRQGTARMPIVDVPESPSPSTSLPAGHTSSLSSGPATHAHCVIQLASSPSTDAAAPISFQQGEGRTVAGQAGRHDAPGGSGSCSSSSGTGSSGGGSSTSSSGDSSTGSSSGSGSSSEASRSEDVGGSEDGSWSESGSEDDSEGEELTRDLEASVTRNSAFTFGTITQSAHPQPADAASNNAHSKDSNGRPAGPSLTAGTSADRTTSLDHTLSVDRSGSWSGTDTGSGTGSSSDGWSESGGEESTHSKSSSAAAGALAIMISPGKALAAVPSQIRHRHQSRATADTTTRQRRRQHHHQKLHNGDRQGQHPIQGPAWLEHGPWEAFHGRPAAGSRKDKGGGAAQSDCRALAGLTGVRRWPYVLYIAMELVTGLTLDVFLKQRAVRLGFVDCRRWLFVCMCSGCCFSTHYTLPCAPLLLIVSRAHVAAPVHPLQIELAPLVSCALCLGSSHSVR